MVIFYIFIDNKTHHILHHLQKNIGKHARSPLANDLKTIIPPPPLTIPGYVRLWKGV